MDKLDTNAWKVLADLLDMARREFGFHGCNDYSLPNTPENMALLTAYDKWNVGKGGTPEGVFVSEDETELYIMDYALIGYFAHLARELAGIDD